MQDLCFQCKYSLQVNVTDWRNLVLYFYFTGNAEISVIWKVICEFVNEDWGAHVTLAKTAKSAIGHFYLLSNRAMVWMI